MTVVIEWPSQWHPVRVTATNEYGAAAFEGSTIDSVQYKTFVTLTEDHTTPLYYFCTSHSTMGVNAFVIASPTYTEASCTECPANFYCPKQSVTPIQCPASSLSNAGSNDIYDCHCQPGFFALFMELMYTSSGS